jgi:hypothetical protein
MNKFTLIIITLVSFSALNFAQSEYVESTHNIYQFLDKMSDTHILENYNNFEKPLTRKYISEFLKKIGEQKNKLSDIDKCIYDDYLSEFEYELYGTINKSQSLTTGEDYDLFSQNEKYFFFNTDKDQVALFINLFGNYNYLGVLSSTKNNNASLGVLGGLLRGTFLNKFGYLFKVSNGKMFGNKQTALMNNNLKNNWKFNEKPSESYFDDTEGYLTADFDLVRFKFGRDRLLVGYGNNVPIFGNASPLFDYLSINFNYKFFSYSFKHGKLLGNPISFFDSISGPITTVTEKYVGYHRIGFHFNKHLSIGMGEIIVYSGRGVDFSYLNPFSFYKTLEHSNQDRDNAILFIDAKNNSIKGLNFFTTLMIDDIDFNKIGKNWWGNQTLWHLGFTTYNLQGIAPIFFQFEYMRVEPYVFSHRINRNNYTNINSNLAGNIEPNSELYFGKINYRFSHRINFNILFSYKVHGANPVDLFGSVQKNVGGDIDLGHRTFDEEKVSFLNGIKEYNRSVSFFINFEPYKNYIFEAYLNFENNSLLNNVLIKRWFIDFSLSVKI